MRLRSLSEHSEAGFTIVELVVVLTIGAILFGLSTINLGRAQTTASLSSVTAKVISDIKSQQILAMEGDNGSTSSAQPQGLYLQSTTYTLFAGSSFDSSDPYDSTVSVDPVSLTTTIPSATLLFNKGDGTVSNYSSTKNTITLSQNGVSKKLTLNQFGAVSVQ